MPRNCCFGVITLCSLKNILIIFGPSFTLLCGLLSQPIRLLEMQMYIFSMESIFKSSRINLTFQFLALNWWVLYRWGLEYGCFLWAADRFTYYFIKFRTCVGNNAHVKLHFVYIVNFFCTNSTKFNCTSRLFFKNKVPTMSFFRYVLAENALKVYNSVWAKTMEETTFF